MYFLAEVKMKPNNEAMRISGRPGDDLKVYEVLREWGYSENVIRRLLADERALDHNSQRAERPIKR